MELTLLLHLFLHDQHCFDMRLVSICPCIQPVKVLKELEPRAGVVLRKLWTVLL